jgi:hypothetical protein
MSYNIDWPSIDQYNDPTGGYNNSLGNEANRPDYGPPLGESMGMPGNVPDAVAADLIDNTDTSTRRGPYGPVGSDGYYTDTSGNSTGGRPLTVEEKAFQEKYPNGGSFSNPLAGVPVPGNGRQPTVEEQSFQNTYPNGGSFPNVSPIAANALPNPGKSSGTSDPAQDFINTFSPHTADESRIVRDASGNVIGVRSPNGYFDANFQGTVDAPGKNSIMTNYQGGDRMQGTLDELRILAAGNYGSVSDSARAVLRGNEQYGQNFANSQTEADWGARHNNQIQNRVAAGEFAQSAGGVGGGNFNGRLGGAPTGGVGGLTQNLAALQNLQSQQWTAPAGGIMPDSQAFPEATKIVGELAQLKGIQLAPDPLDGNLNIVFSENGQIRHIPMNQWADWAGVIEQRLAAQNAPLAADTNNNYGGGYAPRGNYPPRGPYTPPATNGTPPMVTGPLDQMYLQANGQMPNMAGYGELDANRLWAAQHGGKYPPSPGVPGSFVTDTAAAVGNTVNAMAAANAMYTNANYGPGDSGGYAPISGSNTAAAAARNPYEFPYLTPEQDTGLAGAYGDPAMVGIPGGSTTLPPRMRRA